MQLLERENADLTAKLAAVACEVCWTTSWTPIERIEEANGVNTKHKLDGSDLARCEYCYLQAKLMKIELEQEEP